MARRSSRGKAKTDIFTGGYRTNAGYAGYMNFIVLSFLLHVLQRAVHLDSRRSVQGGRHAEGYGALALLPFIILRYFTCRCLASGEMALVHKSTLEV